MADAIVVAGRYFVPVYQQSLLESMAENWHAVSDHAADGTLFGGPLCNCVSIAARALNLGWYPNAE